MLSFEEAFMKIEEATGIKDTDVLVTQFIKAEERNFGLFKFINDQAEDIDRMESQISTITQEIERLRDATDLTNQDIQRRRDIKQMEVKLRQLESEAERFTLDFNYGQGRVESIMTCVQQIFNLLDCEENAELLGTQGVTEINMMTYMGIVE